MKILDEPKTIRLKIMDFLARREYSSKEIYQKMSRRVEFREMLDDVIQQLVEDGLISDARFAESYFQSRKIEALDLLELKMNSNKRVLMKVYLTKSKKELNGPFWHWKF